jgi:2'-hydroxyisoflavone reductase
MRILVVGGTRFIGRHVVEAADRAGHDLTLLHRTPSDVAPASEHVLADRDGDLSALAGLRFDATVDLCAYLPGQVRSLHAALGERAGRYLVISSTSVYADPAGPGFDETSPTVPPASPEVTEITDTTYGPLKVAVEHAATQLWGAHATVVRPTYVVGPWDYTRRFTSWVERVAAGGEILAPGDPDDPLQLVDVRDLAAFVVGLLEGDVAGTFHAVGQTPPYSFADMLSDLLAAVGPADTRLTWVDEAWLLAQGESDATIPLWGGGDPWIAANAASPAAARAAGLPTRTVGESARDVLATLSTVAQAPSPGLTREREAELLAAWHARG